MINYLGLWEILLNKISETGLKETISFKLKKWKLDLTSFPIIPKWDKELLMLFWT